VDNVDACMPGHLGGKTPHIQALHPDRTKHGGISAHDGSAPAGQTTSPLTLELQASCALVVLRQVLNLMALKSQSSNDRLQAAADTIPAIGSRLPCDLKDTQEKAQRKSVSPAIRNQRSRSDSGDGPGECALAGIWIASERWSTTSGCRHVKRISWERVVQTSTLGRPMRAAAVWAALNNSGQALWGATVSTHSRCSVCLRNTTSPNHFLDQVL